MMQYTMANILLTINSYHEKMNVQKRSLYHHISWRFTTDFPGRQIPKVLLQDGNPGYIINQWIYDLLVEEITQSKLESYLSPLLKLYDFFITRQKVKPDANPANLLRDFVDAMKNGTDSYCYKRSIKREWLQNLGLFWKPLDSASTTIKRYLDAINVFDKWQAKHHGAKLLNPSEERFMTEFEKHRDFLNRNNWDMFSYLHETKRHTTTDYTITAYGKHIHKRFLTKLTSIPKALPFNRFIELVELTPNPRDKLLWLLMGGGSLRQSETLHIFYTDLKVNLRSGLLEVMLADPEKGMVSYENQNGKHVTTTRTQFFREMYPSIGPWGRIQPRTLYGKKGTGFHSGFKGMTFGESNAACLFSNTQYIGQDYDTHAIFWCDIRFQNYFRIVLEEYICEYFKKNRNTGLLHPPGWPNHPWLFISGKGNYGSPLTVHGLKDAWQGALKRIGLRGYGLHSLRHLYGYYLANVKRVPIDLAQICFHHASIESTKVYYCFDAIIAQDALTRKLIEDAGLDPECYLAPELPAPQFPEHWSTGLLKKRT